MHTAIHSYRLRLKIFVGILVSVGFLLAGVYLLIFHEITSPAFKDLLLNYGVATACGGIVWAYFEKEGWRRPIWKWVGVNQLLGFPPDFRGRWVGSLDRDGENSPHPFAIEIEQTMTTLQVTAYSSRGGSECILDDVACDKSEKTFWLCYYWQGEGGPLPNQTEAGGKFVGYTTLKLVKVKKGKRALEGHYFTNRKPEQTKGKVRVSWESLEFKRKVK